MSRWIEWVVSKVEKESETKRRRFLYCMSFLVSWPIRAYEIKVKIV